MATARAWHSATLLTDRRVLIEGERHGPFGRSRLSGAVRPRRPAPSVRPGQWARRDCHTATLLFRRRVLIAGRTGRYGGFDYSASAELYQP